MTAATPRTSALSNEDVQRLLRPRRVWAQRDALRSIAIALVSTVVVFGLLGYIISRSTGWQSVRTAFFSWPDFKAALPSVWDGFKLNVKIFMIAEPIILVLGLLLAIARSSRGAVLFPLRFAAITYIDVFRGAPALLVILTLGFGMPALRLIDFDRLHVQPALVWGGIACILTSSAYQAENFRAGIESVHASQRAAARSLGLTGWQAMRYVVLPQAIRRVIPPTLSGFVGLQKETALIATLGPLEATRRAQIYSSLNFNFTSYLVAGLLFIAITIPLARLTDYLLNRTERQRAVGGAV